ncbi:sulfurtransferase [Actinoplanes sp. NBRC 14428]|nr:sulfurtransferase [Actinoplanes sp. NBRC 14428]
MIEPVVDLRWLREHQDRVVTADVRWYLDGRSGLEAYEKGHLPGAVFIDLDRWLARHGSPADGRHPLPDPEVFAAGMAAAGIGDGDTVIGYDDAGGVIAARLVWMLRVTGHDAALLDGGLSAYEGELVTGPTGRTPAVFTPRPWPADRLVDIDAVTGGNAVVLDARDTARFRGEVEPVDPRPGHIPGARSLPCRENLDESGRFLPVAQLRERFAAVGAGNGGDVVSYCGSGVTACHNLLAMEHAGLGAGRLYPGSWSQYSATDRPAATGD